MSEAFHDLRRIFNHSITVGMVAEHLLSFDADREAQQVNQILSDHNFDFAGVRRLGMIVGYVRRDALQEGTLENYLQEFPQTSLLPEGEGLAEAVRKLQNREPVFVHRSSVVWGIFTGADMNRTAPRLWVLASWVFWRQRWQAGFARIFAKEMFWLVCPRKGEKRSTSYTTNCVNKM